MLQGLRTYSRMIVSVALVGAISALLIGCGSTNPTGATSASPTATSAPPTATPNTVRYIALGASDAVGVGASDPNRTAYVPLLISKLPAGSYALNLGISGETLHQALTDELPGAIQAHPTLITVWLVGNDFKNCVSLSQYTTDLNTLLSQLQTQTSAKVFVANAPDFSALPAIQQAVGAGQACGMSSLSAVRASTQAWNQAIAASVSAHHDTLVDLYNSDLAAHPADISSDGFHPSDAGYLTLANLFWSAITAKGVA